MSKKADNSWVLVGKDGRMHDLSHGMIFIGREECDIVLQAASADKRHAVLCYNNSEQMFHIKDLNSLTGTYVNGIRISEQTYVQLKHLDCIRFGYGPDVFYLEENTNTTSQSMEKTSQKELCKDSVKKSSKSESKKNENDISNSSETSAKTEFYGSELTTLTREDHPPDSLALNLSSSAKPQDKEWDWIGHDGTLSDSPDYSQRSETSSYSAPPIYGATDERDTGSAHSSPAATAFTVAFESEVPRKKLGIRDSISKFAPNKPDVESRVTFHKNSKMETNPKKFPISDGKPPMGKSRTQIATSDLKDINKEIGKITDSTSFLIKKMLNGKVSPEIPEERSKDKHHPNDVDDRSEAGTYTVETEQANCDEEEARKKIDEVFGVIRLSNSVQSSYSSSTTSSSNKHIPRLNGRMKQPILKTPMNPKQRETGVPWNSATKTYGRNRGTGPTPAASTESLNHSDNLSRSLQRTRKASDPPATPDRTRRSSKMASSPKSPAKAKTPSSVKSLGSLSNNLSTAPARRESSGRSKTDEIPRRHSTDSRSEGSKSPHTNIQWQKVPWNLSGTDLDIDCSKSENNSILSDTSTEPSSHSSHSGQSRPEQGPQMRLNRAFALRRARLEAESGKRGKENRSNQQKPIKKSGKLSSSTSTLRDESSSGGCSSSKMNFRVTPTLTKPYTPLAQCTDPLRRKIVSSHNMDDYQCRSSSKEITALDSLVISAIHQLASKLWTNSKHLLERERKKCPKGSDTWLMIDEVLPQVPVMATPEDGDFTKDLSSILKNLKRVEQGLDVLSSILENGRDPEPGIPDKPSLPQNFFVVNM